MANRQINVLIDENLDCQLDENWLKSVAESTLTAQDAVPNAEMGLVITTQEEIKRLNLSYLGRDEATDVIAFQMLPQTEDKGVDTPTFITPPDGLVHLGEVIISYPQAVVQATEQQHSILKELALLITHGVLHLFGYDDNTPELKQQMAAREMEILNTMEGELI